MKTQNIDSWILGALGVTVAVVAFVKLRAPSPKKPDVLPGPGTLPPYDGPKDLDGRVYYDVAVDRLAIRSLPSQDSVVVGSLPVGAIVTSTGYTVGGLLPLSKKYVEIYIPPAEKQIGWVAAAGLTPHNPS